MKKSVGAGGFAEAGADGEDCGRVEAVDDGGELVFVAESGECGGDVRVASFNRGSTNEGTSVPPVRRFSVETNPGHQGHRQHRAGGRLPTGRQRSTCAPVRDPDSTSLPAAVEIVPGDLTIPALLTGRWMAWMRCSWCGAAPRTTVMPVIAPGFAERVRRVVFLSSPHRTAHPFFQPGWHPGGQWRIHTPPCTEWGKPSRLWDSGGHSGSQECLP